MSTENTETAVKPAPEKSDDAPLPTLSLSSSPHVRFHHMTVPKMMLAVVIAMIPAFISSVIFFGYQAILITAVCIAAAVAAEYIGNILFKKQQTIGDWSAVITGVLVAFNVPPSIPLWMAALGSIFAIFIAKTVFGGLGCNFINPALAGRAFLMASYPAPMITFSPTAFGGMSGLADGVTAATSSVTATVDAVTSATPLATIKHAFADGSYAAADFASALTNLLTGNVGGSIGETSALALGIGGIFLITMRIIDARIPIAYIFTVFALFWLANGTDTYFTAQALIAPTFHILGGGLFLGAFFMASDPVTSPITPRGRVIFGVGCGVLTFVIRKFGGYPEGVCFSIMLMNLTVPLIDRYTRPTIYGKVKK